MPEPAPAVTAILLCCNSERYVAAGLRSALDQDCPPLRLIVSDDASSDTTATIVRDMLDTYRGPHRVEFHQQTRNSGSKSAHLNRVFPQADGDIIVSFDDDDVSEPGRVARILQAFAANPHAYAIYSSFSVIDEQGRPRGAGTAPHPPAGMPAREWFARIDAYAAGMTLAIHHDVLDKFGSLEPSIHEDVVLPFRASLLGEVVYIDEPLVRARRHATSLTRDFSAYESLPRYRERFTWGIERAKRHRASRLADIRAAAALMPERAAEFAALEGIVTNSIATAESTAGLVSPSLPTRLSALLRLWRSGAYPEERMRQVLLALTPRLYLHYKRRAIRARKGVTR